MKIYWPVSGKKDRKPVEKSRSRLILILFIMKTTFLKSTMPFAVVAIMGISGAFLTTSMQSASLVAAPKTGYIAGAQGPCSVPVSCNTTPGQICSANGVQAFGKLNNCSEILYRP
jgi:hypothetical protein